MRVGYKKAWGVVLVVMASVLMLLLVFSGAIARMDMSLFGPGLAAVASLITGIHVAHERDEPQSFVTKRGKALGLTVGAIVFLCIVVFLVTALPPLTSEAGDVGRIGLQIFRWPVLAVVMIVGIGLLYRYSTKERTPAWLGVVTAGSVGATVGWLIVSALFAVYAANFASYSKTYGALASIVVLLLWLWLSSLLVLIGAEFDAANT